jgi:hypothetical protein
MPKPVPYDETHPLYHSRSCYEYHENSALIEGIQQAQVLTNTVEIKQGLPVALTDIIESFKSQESENINEEVQRLVYSNPGNLPMLRVVVARTLNLIFLDAATRKKTQENSGAPVERRTSLD